MRQAAVPQQGFALIITISLMILLSLLAVGLLSLSSLTLRSSSQGQAMQQARTNARLALSLAIGDLQKKLGPDQRISAPANQGSPNAPLGPGGAWEATAPGELGSDYDAKDDHFLGWLASDTLLGNDAPGTAPTVAPGADGSVLLVGETTLAKRAGLKGDDQRIAIRKLGIENDTDQGTFAWMAFDESAKARLDLYGPETSNRELADLSAAGSPPRAGIFALDRLGSFQTDPKLALRMASYDTAAVASGIDELPAYRPDLTPWSLSLLTDPVDGGLKGDLSTLFANGAPASIRDSGFYELAGLSTGPSDPTVGLLAEYHDLYTRIGQPSRAARRPGADALAAQIPNGYRGYSGAGTRLRPNRTPPPGPVLVPTVARVDMIFSLVARDPHGGWGNQHKARGNSFMLHMMYLPVITLHNPYDTPLVFDSMKISFRDVPMGFRYYINGQPLTTEMAPLNNLFVNYSNSNNSKEFGITLKTSLSGRADSIRLEPGQTKLFGTPRVPPTWTWDDEEAGAGRDGVNLFDWRSDKTANFDMTPTLITQSTTTGCGFDVDWLLVRNKTPMGNQRGIQGTVGLKATDRVGVEFGPISQPSSDFAIAIDLGTPAGMLRVQYRNERRLKELVEEGTSLRYPDQRSFPALFPDPVTDPPLRASQIYESGSTAVKDYVRAKPFALFSFSGRTTLESFVPSRPFADSSPVNHVVDIDLRNDGTGKAGDQPYELVMMPIRNNTSAIEENRAEQEAYFFGGHGSLNGTTRATFYEIPRIPLQSLAQFRHANLAGSSYQPFVTYTVGESRAHPMLPSDTVSATDPGDRSTMLDHTWLSNSALWDRYFLSTLADYEGPAFGASSRSLSTVRSDFFSGAQELLNPRFLPLVSGSKASEVADQLGSQSAWEEVARYLALKGGFNVNSTSVDAWTAVLSSLRDSELFTEQGYVDTDDHAAFPRTRHPSDRNIDGQPFPLRETRWRGFRQLDESRVRELAELIVGEVRRRGPFLSLSEFVNRRLGPASDDRCLRGALQSAIEATHINGLAEADGLELDASTLGEHNYATPEAAFGSNTAGAPGALSQGDLLSALGSQLTVRGDTFVIRCYGEAVDADGKVTARAWCEGVVQRMPAFVDPADEPETPVASLNPTNQRFGRRFELLSFRWLAPEEI